MKQLTISYFDHFIRFCPATEMEDEDSAGYLLTTDDNLDDCFAFLLEGQNVCVQYRQGLRRIVRYLLDHYRYVKAAGGLVQVPDGRRLLILREGMWDVPKGMVEKGETIAEAALREVREETGIADLSLGSLMLKTYHIYDKYGGWHLKQTSWFDMSTSTAATTRPQIEENIDAAEWILASECRELLSQSFASLQLLSHKI